MEPEIACPSRIACCWAGVRVLQNRFSRSLRAALASARLNSLAVSSVAAWTTSAEVEKIRSCASLYEGARSVSILAIRRSIRSSSALIDLDFFGSSVAMNLATSAFVESAASAVSYTHLRIFNFASGCPSASIYKYIVRF